MSVRKTAGFNFSPFSSMRSNLTLTPIVSPSISSTSTSTETLRRNNPLLFAKTLDFHPDPIQSELLAADDDHIIVNCTRQWGKSTVTALKAVYTAWRSPETLTIVAGPTERQSGEFVRKAAAFVRKLGLPVRGDGLNRCSLVLPNQSRLIGLPEMEENIRGFSAQLIIIDEAARVSDDLIDALRPMLAATNGKLWMLSTPGPSSGFFFETWRSDSQFWRRISVPATECPRIRPEFLAREREALGDQAFRREYMCEFTGGDTALFTRELVESVIDPGVRPLFPIGDRQ